MGEQFLSPNYDKNRQYDQQEEQEEDNNYEYEEDEALSLCDLALDDSYNSKQGHHTRGPSASDQLFEFFSDDFSSEMMAMTTMCSADDVIIKGQLLPFTAEHQQVPAIRSTAQNAAFRKRSNSSPESSSHASSVTMQQDMEKMMRTSRSMDSHTMRHRPLVSEERSTSVRNGNMVVKRTGSSNRSKLCFSMFGPVKLPAEMELKDIKSRQFRRSPSNLIPSPEESATKGGGSWKFLKALSCKDPRSVAVAASSNS